MSRATVASNTPLGAQGVLSRLLRPFVGGNRPPGNRPRRDQWEVVTEEGEPRYKPIDLKLVRRLLRLLAPFKWRYALGVTLGTGMLLLEMLSPRFTQHLIDYATGFSAGSLPHMPTITAAGWHVAAVVGLWALVLSIAVILQRYTILVMTAAGERVQFDIRRRLFAHLQQLSMSYYDRTKLGRIISRCTSDVNSLREVNVWGIWQVFANSTQMLIAALYMSIYTDWRLVASVAWLAPVLYVGNRIYLRRAAHATQVQREGWTRVSTNLAENITGMRVVAAFNRQVTNLGVFNRLQDINTENNIQVARLNGLYQPLLQVVAFVGKIIILSYGAFLVVSTRGALGRGATVGGVVAAFLYWDNFAGSVQNFGTFYSQLMMAMAGAERVFDLLETPPDVQDLPDAKPLPHIKGRVEMRNVTFGYNADRPVLHEINFETSPGQMIALVGATGSGKSSIISLIARFYQPQQGQVLVDGHDLRHVIGDSLHRQMGLVLQVNYLFTGTVLENICYAKPSATREEVIAAAQALGTWPAICQLSDGLDSQVGERGANMSVGQRQLICFTRAYLADPRIFMLDEATSSVDTATEQLLQESLERLLAGRTTFIVAHRLSTIMRADIILVIDQGKIIERGTHSELLANDGRYAHLYKQFVMQD
jgi:ATP-binding cassette subfamily B protein